MYTRNEMAKTLSIARENRDRSVVPMHNHASHDSNYNTILSSEEETKFQSWKAQNAPKDSGEDYDLRGAYKEGLKKDQESQHWSDKFKKPNHPTFSDQSQYAEDEPEKAGRWEGDKYIPPKRK